MGYYIKGLGSMGKRRVRCLLELGIKPEEIWGNDIRDDRREETKANYGINVVSDENEVDFETIKAIIVSLPPDRHKIGTDIAVRYGKPVFVEASVLLEEVEEIRRSCEGIFIAPSCTFMFHPMIREVKRIVESGKLGKVCNFSYHSGQYLPDWHPWENVKDFYVSNRKTGGAREIVPYELTWITDVFGYPSDIKGFFRKTAEVGCDIEDSYVASLGYDDMVGSLVVDVVSRYPARNLIVNLQNGQIQWKWDDERLIIYDASEGKFSYKNQDKQTHESGYSSMIGENMYVAEMKAFIDGIGCPANYPNTIERDIKILKMLNNIEKSDGFQTVTDSCDD